MKCRRKFCKKPGRTSLEGFCSPACILNELSQAQQRTNVWYSLTTDLTERLADSEQQSELRAKVSMKAQEALLKAVGMKRFRRAMRMEATR